MQVNLFSRALTAVLFVFSSIGFAGGQSAPGLRGVVEDDSGAIIPGAQVVLQDSKGTEAGRTASNSVGEFAFSQLPAGQYSIRVQAEGFKATEIKAVSGAVPAQFLHIRMKVAAVTQEITVKAGNPVSMDGNLNSFEVNHDLLKSLPVQDDDPLAAASAFLDPAANGVEGTKVVVDGMESTGLEVPSSSVKSVAVNKNPYSGEFGRPGKGRVEVATRPGSMTRVHHHVVMTFRNSALDATNAFASTRPDMSRSFLESDINGPLYRHKGTFYFGGDYLDDNQNAVIHASTPTGTFSQNAPTPDHNGRFLGRMDYQLNQFHTLSARYAFNSDAAQNRGIGGFDLPTRGYDEDALRQEVRLGETALLGMNFSNEARFDYKKRDDRLTPLSAQPASIVLGAFSSGGAQINQSHDQQIFTVENISTWVRGNHTLRFGATAKRHNEDLTDESNFGGTLTFSDLAAFNANQPSQFSITRGNPEAIFSQGEYSYFFQDEMHLLPNLTVMLGLRHELQQHLHETNNFAPRAGISYSPGQSGFVLRAGGGIFYDRRPWNMGEQALLYDGNHLRSVVLQNPAFPISPVEFAGAPPSTFTISPSLVAPYQIQASVGVDKQIDSRSSVSVEYSMLRGLKLFRLRDINAPLPATGIRPNPAFFSVDQFESTGSSLSNSVAVTYRAAIGTRLELLSQYTYSRSYDNTSGMFFLPADNFNLAPEWGRSDFDRRHRFNLAGIVQLPHEFKLGTITNISSGIPFNITTGLDNNQDGVFNDRPAGVSRNTGDGPMYSDIDIRLSKRFILGPLREHGTKYLEARIDAFNALNQVNAPNYVGVVTSSFFGRANSAQPARHLQLSIKTSF